MKNIEKLQKRITNAGIDAKIVYDLGDPYIATEETEKGILESYEKQKVHISIPPLTYDGWTMVGSVDKLDNGELIFNQNPNFTNPTVNSWNPHNYECEYCKQSRDRIKTYVIQGPDGKYHQVGKNCLQKFSGIPTTTLWYADYDLEKKFTEEDDYETTLYRNNSRRYPTAYVLAVALAFTDGGKYYVGRNNTANGTSTVSMVNSYLTEPEKYEQQGANSIDPKKYMSEAKKLLKTIKYEGGTHYEDNMRKLVKQENISPEHIGYVSSIIVGKLKQEQKTKKPHPHPKGMWAKWAKKYKTLKQKL